MDNRTKHLLKIRPDIPSAMVEASTREEEKFQNATLRPILKLQHPLFIQVFKLYLLKKKNQFFALAKEKRSDYINAIFLKDVAFRNELKGIVIGHFTVEEYKTYSHYSSALNKRMMSMLKERILNSLEELEH